MQTATESLKSSIHGFSCLGRGKEKRLQAEERTCEEWKSRRNPSKGEKWYLKNDIDTTDKICDPSLLNS